MKREKNLQTSRRVISFVVIIMLAMFLFFILALIISRNNTGVSENTPQQTDDTGEENEDEELPADAVSAAEAVTEDDSRLQISASEEAEEETSVSAEPEETDSGRKRWQVYIQPDMPEPFIEVLEQYEEFLNADNQDLNDENVREKIDTIDGEWRFLDDELCSWETAEECIRYSLTDLSGDGFPELIMGYYSDYSDETFPEVVYYYSKTDGIEMQYATSYYTMTLYEGGIIEYKSGGVNYTIDYVQFRQDTEELIGLDHFFVETVVDGEDVRGGAIYYREGDTDEAKYPITEEEFKRITGGYTQKPVEPEWTPLTPGSESAAVH